MGTEDKVILELLESHTTLTSDNPTLELGQRVFVTGITDALGNGEKIGDGATVYTSLKWQRCETLKTIDLTSANTTYTLPKILGGYQRVSIYADNGGTYKMTLAVTNSETVDGIAAGTWEIEGKGRIIVESDGTNWQVMEYEDYLTDGASQKIWKYKDGSEYQEIARSGSISISTTHGTIFRTTAWTAITRFHQMFSINTETTEVKSITALGLWSIHAGGNPSNTITGIYYSASSIAYGANNMDFKYKTRGRWRA